MSTVYPFRKYYSELDELYENLKSASDSSIGYPINQFFDNKQVRKFLDFSLNNCGDPFESSFLYGVNTHSFEREVVSMCAELFHAPADNFWGYVTNGGTEGNLHGLYIAREKYPNAKVYYSDQSHYSISKNIRLLRMEGVEIPSLDNGEIDYEKLNETIAADNPEEVIIMANIGTTLLGAVDSISAVKEILEINNITNHYIHCDAAFFGFILPFLEPEFTRSYDFAAGIDSISASGHKAVGSPIPCGVAICLKNNVDLVARRIEYIDSIDNTITGSRNGFTPLLLWYEFKSMLDNPNTHKKALLESYELADYAIYRFNELGIKSWRNYTSPIVVFEKPSDKIRKRWQLANQGKWAHIICLPNVKKDTVDMFIDDIIEDISE